MYHITCDLCGKDLTDDDEDRFIVRIDVRPADKAWQITEDDLEPNNLELVSQMIQQSEVTGSLNAGEGGPVRRRFDLCAHCRARFLKNPLNRHPVAEFNFSPN